MSEYNAKNYTEQGGEVTHIGGTLIIEEGASVEGLPSGGDLPAVTSDDNGKILRVSEGEWNKADMPTELPVVSASDNGKVLGVSEGQWDKVSVGLPVKTINVTGTTQAANVSVTFPQGFERSDLPTYAAGPREFILKVVYGTDRELEFAGYDGQCAIFRNLETMRSDSNDLNEIIVIIPYVINGFLKDKVFSHSYSIS